MSGSRGTAFLHPPGRGGRADAVRNRAELVAAARSLLTADSGLKLSDVAKAAGLGQGTVYRHFPTVAALLAEVYKSEVVELVEAVPVLLSEHPPIEALGTWLRQVAAYAEVKRGLMAAVEESIWQSLTDRSHGPIGDAVSRLLDAGKRAGAVRPDIEAHEVLLLIGWLSRTPLPDQPWHILDLVVDACRPREM